MRQHGSRAPISTQQVDAEHVFPRDRVVVTGSNGCGMLGGNGSTVSVTNSLFENNVAKGGDGMEGTAQDGGFGIGGAIGLVSGFRRTTLPGSSRSSSLRSTTSASGRRTQACCTVSQRAAITFAASAFSLPMIMHRDVDTVTAIVTSINAVLRSSGIHEVSDGVWMMVPRPTSPCTRPARASSP